MSSSVLKSISRLCQNCPANQNVQICDRITTTDYGHWLWDMNMCFNTFIYNERVCCFYVSYDVQFGIILGAILKWRHLFRGLADPPSPMSLRVTISKYPPSPHVIAKKVTHNFAIPAHPASPKFFVRNSIDMDVFEWNMTNVKYLKL